MTKRYSAHRHEPRHISPEEFSRDWPKVTLKVIKDGVAVERTGQVIGRTVAGAVKWDVRLDDRSIIPNVPAAECTIIKFPSASAGAEKGEGQT